MKYRAPLLNAFQRASVRKGFLKPLEIIELEALAWVLRCKPVHYQVNEMVFGILLVSVRFQNLRTMFEVHKLSLQPGNPLVLLLQQRRTMSMSSLLFHLQSDVLYSQFAATVVGVPVAQSWHTTYPGLSFAHKSGPLADLRTSQYSRCSEGPVQTSGNGKGRFTALILIYRSVPCKAFTGRT
jgi:hypothetical protein